MKKMIFVAWALFLPAVFTSLNLKEIKSSKEQLNLSENGGCQGGNDGD